MKLLLTAAALLLLSGSRDEVALRFAPAEDTVLARTFDAEASYRLTAMTFSVNGEEIDTGGEVGDLRMEFQEHVQVRDELGSSADGRPASLVRRFEELSQETSWSAGEEESTSTSSSPFQNRSVRFTWNDDEDRYAAEAADDGELEAELAELLDEDMDLRLVLPEEEVEVGDEWKLDARLYLAFMWPSGLLEWQEGDEEPTEEDRARNRQTIENLEGEGRARLSEVLEEDGRRVAVLAIELEIETYLEFEQELAEGQGTMGIKVTIERTLEGELRWDLEAGHALSAELEGEGVRETTRTSEVEQDGEAFALAQTERQEGTLRYRATIERE